MQILRPSCRQQAIGVGQAGRAFPRPLPTRRGLRCVVYAEKTEVASAVQATEDKAPATDKEPAEQPPAVTAAAAAPATPAEGNTDVPRPPVIPVAETICMQGGCWLLQFNDGRPASARG